MRHSTSKSIGVEMGRPIAKLSRKTNFRNSMLAMMSLREMFTSLHYGIYIYIYISHFITGSKSKQLTLWLAQVADCDHAVV